MGKAQKQEQEQRIWARMQEVIGCDDGTPWSLLQIASINSEIRSKVIAENEDGEKLREV